ncbi:PGF-CTERM-anchored ABC transporter substrate-binding protein [Natrinema salsiterrestre]|uniref:PGF-CTERM-anchored ABC transporter substrate-binding protein n=1 Tax=Natrinema salsiterrestre TaxID=2950540 RepID=A0A9Q4L7K7_9EURY|nr:PGF-CTERM-anchored ABC transporter substrate-binding protein [Natrinema salsiterrestre]MDF9746711.1 PGF-CTERM-anchored ABC transporter substrate-binding protein [Natrinema salsiterrestre]
MRRYLPVFLALLIAVSAFAPAGAAQSNGGSETVACEFPLEVTDATGEQITLDERPESVVALQPSDAQTMFEIGAEDRLVGMPDNPATSDLELGNRTAVTDTYQLVPERVIDLDPDLVLAANATEKESIEQLRNAGLTVYHFETAESIDDVRSNVVTTGELTGECDGARATVDWMDRQLAVVDRVLESVDRPLAYYAMGDGYTAGSGTFIHEAMTTAGVENVADRADIQGYGQINPETVVDENPEWIIYPDDRSEPPIHQSVEATTAFQNDNVLAVNANQMSQPAPQIVYAIVDIVETVHPDAYEQASDDLDGTNESDTDPADGEPAESPIPGFGVVATLVALLAVVGFVSRRR